MSSVRPIRTKISEVSLRLIGIPSKFLNTTISDFECSNPDLKDVRSFVKRYIEHIDDNFYNSSGIYFCGSNGVGKTMLSCVILKEAYRHRYSCRRVTFSEYIEIYTRSWSCSSEEREVSEDELYTYYKGVEFLVLEEAGKEIDSKIAAPILEDLLRYREDKGFVTIFCTNIDIDTMKEKYGSSIVSLIKGSMTPITIVSRDERPQAFKERRDS